MRHVFVSYCREDEDFARILEENIRQNELAAWRDQALSAGEDWRAEIDAGIRDALAAIVILSPASIRSAYVNYEWAFARGSGIPVVPILLEAVDGVLDPRLKALKCLDFTDHAARPWDSLIQSLRDLQDALRPTTVQAPRDAPPVLKQAVRELDSMEENRCRDAIASLAQMDHPAIAEILAEAARHPVQQVRIGAAVQLGVRQDARAIPYLLEVLRTRSCEGWMLGKVSEDIGEAAVPALIEAMKEEDWYVRERVYWSLGLIGTPTGNRRFSQAGARSGRKQSCSHGERSIRPSRGYPGASRTCPRSRAGRSVASRQRVDEMRREGRRLRRAVSGAYRGAR